MKWKEFKCWNNERAFINSDAIQFIKDGNNTDRTWVYPRAGRSFCVLESFDEVRKWLVGEGEKKERG